MAQVKRSKIISPARIERKHADKSNPPTGKRVYPQGYFGATLKNIRVAPQKMRLVVDQIRG